MHIDLNGIDLTVTQSPAPAEPATERQVAFLAKLRQERDDSGMGETPKNLTKTQASQAIEWLLNRPVREGANRATDKQKSYLRTLMIERDHSTFDYARSAWLDESLPLHSQLWAHLAKDDASRMIEDLRTMPRKAAPDEPQEPLAEGIYVRDDRIYKVLRAVHGSGRLYVKEMSDSGRWIRTPHTPSVYSLNIRGDVRKLTEEEAAAFGKIYGVCLICGRTLTDEDSIERGIGPVCASKQGW